MHLSNAELISAIDRFILESEVLVVHSDPDETVAGIIPGLLCLQCGRTITLTWGEDQYLWLSHEGEDGVDLDDPLIVMLLQRIRETHPHWRIKSSCIDCNDEIVFPSTHTCQKAKETLRMLLSVSR